MTLNTEGDAGGGTGPDPSSSSQTTGGTSDGWRLKMAQLYDDVGAGAPVASEPEDHRPCAGLRRELKHCLLESDCVQINHKSPKECLSVTDGSVPQDCIILRKTFFECKRSLLDARQRFRGRKGY